jgi:hypothetical protein
MSTMEPFIPLKKLETVSKGAPPTLPKYENWWEAELRQ